MDAAVTPVTLSYTTIQGVAECMYQRYHHRQSQDDEQTAGLSLDLDAILTAIHGVTEWGDGRDASYVDDDGCLHILLPNMTPIQRDRHTIARELGHYYLHYRYQRSRGCPPSTRFAHGRSIANTQAEVFGSAMLMPRREFTQAYTDTGRNINDTADLFQVTPGFARTRAMVLGLIPQEEPHGASSSSI